MITESELNEKMATPEAKDRIKRYVDSLKTSPMDRNLAVIVARKRVRLEIARGFESYYPCDEDSLAHQSRIGPIG